MFIERDGKFEILSKGFHDISGGIYVLHDYDIVDVPLAVAVSLIKILAADFLFVAESDRSRFRAGILAPSLMTGRPSGSKCSGTHVIKYPSLR